MRYALILLMSGSFCVCMAQLICPSRNVYGEWVYPKLPQDKFYGKHYVKPEAYDSLPEQEIVTAAHVIKSIDLADQANKSIFWINNPKTGIVALFEVIKYGVVKNEIHAFKTNDFQFPKADSLNCEQFLSRIILVDSVEEVSIDENGTESTKKVLKSDTISYARIKSFRVNEVWYFNKKWARLEKRIVGIAPVWLNPKTGKDEELFWINYDEARNLFASFAVNNSVLNHNWKTYEQLFMFRFFNCYVYKEYNVFDRNKVENGKAIDALIESEKTKSKILDNEQDMWTH